MTVGELIECLESTDPSNYVVFCEHPYRGSTATLVPTGDAEMDEVQTPKGTYFAVCVSQSRIETGFHTSWPGRY